MHRPSLSWFGLAAGLCSLAALLGVRPVGAEVGGPSQSLKFVVAKSEIGVTRYPRQPIFLDPGVYVAAVGGPFELRVHRSSYSQPITVEQVIRTPSGVQERSLSPTLLDGWNGLARFLRVTVTDPTGQVRMDTEETFCPDAYDPQRVGGGGPDQPTYPTYCSSNPFTLGTVWGIDQDWAVDPVGYYYSGLYFHGPNGHYTVTMSIAPRYRTLFHIPADQATATVGATVTVCQKRNCYGPGGSSTSGDGSAAPRADVPTMNHPDPSVLPDLIPLPSWGINVGRRHHHDYLNFGATVWVGGNSQLDVEGFRRSGQDVMDAYQYFYRDGQVVGRARAGTMGFDVRRGHQHWHFEQFAAYSLLDSTKQQTVLSHKQGFCIAPTDAIDLMLPGAQWHPDYTGFYTHCGYETAIWVRETMPVGWGDTYFQYLAGQAFDVTDVPNGTYYIAVTANPTGTLRETNTRNDTRLRKVILGGQPGARTVKVPPWNGIDTEGGCPPFCGYVQPGTRG